MPFFVYAIESLQSKRVYIGHTNDLRRRLHYHNAGYVKATAKDRPWRVIGLEEMATKGQAMWIESSLKRSKGKRTGWLLENRQNR